MFEKLRSYMKAKKLTPARAIRAKCIDCCGGNLENITNCTIIDCPLYMYRKGRKPKTEELEHWQSEYI